MNATVSSKPSPDADSTTRTITITLARIAALRAEIARADTKANVFIALAAPAVGFAVVTGVLTGLHPAAATAGWTAVAMAATAIAVLAYALWPRLSKHNGIGALAVYPGCGTVAAHTQTLRHEQRDAAAITVSKYRHVRLGMRLLAAAGLAAAVAVGLTPLS